MSTESKKTLALQPTREYHVPGGPLAKNLGKVDVYVLAEIRRGGDEDLAGQRR
jgi:hypothetical protein